MKKAVIFGGAGFVGTFFSKYLLENELFEKVYIVDIEDPNKNKSKYLLDIHNSKKIQYIHGDVRKKINLDIEKIDLIANFAAIHREPGHENNEYYETNLPGAENVCDFATRTNCKNIIFTSSISPYGPCEDVKDENTIPTPETAYGGSKLAAEKIHRIWKEQSNENNLIIARPGVIFGPGEGGNVTRLIKAVTNRYFLYMGNKETRKAGIYIKELCLALGWGMQKISSNNNLILMNLTMNPGPSIYEYVQEICNVNKIKRNIFSVPFSLILFSSIIIEFLLRPFGVKHPFNPVRIKKLVRSNNIHPGFLVENNYQYKYSLHDAMSDWKRECPEDWK